MSDDNNGEIEALPKYQLLKSPYIKGMGGSKRDGGHGDHVSGAQHTGVREIKVPAGASESFAIALQDGVFDDNVKVTFPKSEGQKNEAPMPSEFVIES